MVAAAALLIAAGFDHGLAALDACGWLDPLALSQALARSSPRLDLPVVWSGQVLVAWLHGVGAGPAAGAAVAAACQPVSPGDWRNLLAVIRDFLSLSLSAFGDGNTLLSECHEMAVSQCCWLSSRQFADLFAISEAAPGPGSMIVGLLGMGRGGEAGTPVGAARGCGCRTGDPVAFHPADGGGIRAD